MNDAVLDVWRGDYKPCALRRWEGYEKTMETGHTKYGHDTLRVPAVDKAGRAMSIAFTVAMLLKDDGKPSEPVTITSIRP